ncbi:MAG: dienelactone hydrolase family protein [Alphaproteobacteria bacterium]
MARTEISYTTRADENFTGYLATPDGHGKVPGILLITAIFGIDDEMKELSNAWADDGFVVSTPDIFWRVMPGPTADMEKAFARFGAFDQDQGMLDIEDLIGDLRARPQCNGRVAVLGFCFGGQYAHLSAARLGIDAAGAFHGTKIGAVAGEADRITCPVSFHFGEQDPVVPMDEVEIIRQAYEGHANADIVVHPGASHNFSMPHKDGYHPQAAKASRDAVLGCFQLM